MLRTAPTALPMLLIMVFLSAGCGATKSSPYKVGQIYDTTCNTYQYNPNGKSGTNNFLPGNLGVHVLSIDGSTIPRLADLWADATTRCDFAATTGLSGPSDIEVKIVPYAQSDLVLDNPPLRAKKQPASTKSSRANVSQSLCAAYPPKSLAGSPVNLRINASDRRALAALLNKCEPTADRATIHYGPAILGTVYDAGYGGYEWAIGSFREPGRGGGSLRQGFFRQGFFRPRGDATWMLNDGLVPCVVLRVWHLPCDLPIGVVVYDRRRLRATSTVYMPSYGGPSYEHPAPASFVLGNTSRRNYTWKNWGSPTALGHGQVECYPCAGGTTTWQSETLTAAHIVACQGRRYYARLLGHDGGVVAELNRQTCTY